MTMVILTIRWFYEMMVYGITKNDINYDEAFEFNEALVLMSRNMSHRIMKWHK